MRVHGAGRCHQPLARDHLGARAHCPYKGQTTGYWSFVADEKVQKDVAWTYDFPTAAVLPIAGLIAFYNEQVDVFLDGELLERPHTHFSPRKEAE
jgi:uncharacterized protein (DUF427 family)